MFFTLGSRFRMTTLPVLGCLVALTMFPLSASGSEEPSRLHRVDSKLHNELERPHNLQVSSFDGTCAKLSWSPINIQASSRVIEIECSTDGVTWTSAGSVPATETKTSIKRLQGSHTWSFRARLSGSTKVSAYSRPTAVWIRP